MVSARCRESGVFYLPVLASLLEIMSQRNKWPQGALRISNTKECVAAQRKQRIREINWGSCNKNLFIWPDLNILVKEGFYREKMISQAWPGLGIPAVFIWPYTRLDHQAFGDKD